MKPFKTDGNGGGVAFFDHDPPAAQARRPVRLGRTG
jgi:hypothetical protein